MDAEVEVGGRGYDLGAEVGVGGAEGGMVLEALPLSSMTGMVEFGAVDNGFWKFEFPLFVRLAAGELLTDLGVVAEADWLRRVESWSPDTHTLVPSDLLAQSFDVPISSAVIL